MRNEPADSGPVETACADLTNGGGDGDASHDANRGASHDDGDASDANDGDANAPRS
jgi:hypothetical protein